MSTKALVPAASRVSIYTPSVPKRLQLTQTMVDDFIDRPDLGAKVIFNETLDAFQSVRLKQMVMVPRVMDSSGFSSAKTRTFFIAFNLRCMLIGDHHAGVYYQNFDSGQRNFWQYYDVFKRKSEFFRAQLGKMDLETNEVENTKGTKMGASCWIATFLNESKLFLPAPSFLTNSASQAGQRFNDLGIDEFTKIEAMGSTGIDDQLIGRCTRASFNKEHPFWCNHNVFLATAEDMMHPAYERYQLFKREVDRGNPEYSIISFCFKDWSHLVCDTGKPFNETLRENRVLKDLMGKWTKSKRLQEGLGIWSKNGRGWYDQEVLDNCISVGKERGLRPIVRRDDPTNDIKDSEHVYYFLGADPAKGDKKKADDGALVLLRAVPLTVDAGDNLNDWQLDYVWAYKVRKADAPQWASVIHLKDRHFKFAGVMLDHGGGGQWIKPELAKERQSINDVDTIVIPITTLDDSSTATANPCLCMFSKSDDLIKQKWETIKGDDNLIDIAHTELLEAMQRGRVGFPRPYSEVEHEEREKWGQERYWSNLLLDLARQQLASISVETTDEGKWALTKNNAKKFDSRGKKDFAYACVHAYTRFLVWLKCSERDWMPKEEDACMGE
jgi:hypothetical protein